MGEALVKEYPKPCGLVRNVLVILADQLQASSIQAAILDSSPNTIVTVVRSGSEAVTEIRSNRHKLAILGMTAADRPWIQVLPQILTLLYGMPVLVIAGRHAPRTLRAVNKFPFLSIFDPVTEDPAELRRAMSVVANGYRYFSKSIHNPIQSESELKPELLLSITEEKILSVIGDGSSDTEASPRLALAIATVATHRRNIMKKLNLHHRGELVRFAIKHDYVTRMLDGSLMPGLVSVLSQVEIR